jgi:hypothetical protein
VDIVAKYMAKAILPMHLTPGFRPQLVVEIE